LALHRPAPGTGALAGGNTAFVAVPEAPFWRFMTVFDLVRN
jgi:hypothetical protein